MPDGHDPVPIRSDTGGTVADGGDPVYRLVMTLLVMILVLGGGSYLVGRSLNRHQDVAAIAGSAAVTEADHEATATLRTRLAGVLAAVGPAQATAVTDRCSTLRGKFDNGGRV